MDPSVRPRSIRLRSGMGGWTWRNEDPERLDGPIRAREFLRVEYFWLASFGEAVRLRAAVRDAVTSLLRQLGLSVQLVVGEGCMDIPQDRRAGCSPYPRRGRRKPGLSRPGVGRGSAGWNRAARPRTRPRLWCRTRPIAAAPSFSSCLKAISVRSETASGIGTAVQSAPRDGWFSTGAHELVLGLPPSGTSCPAAGHTGRQAPAL